MFKAPNFSCRVSEKEAVSQKRSTQLVYAESEQAARDFLDKKGYIVHSVKPYDFEKEWEKDTKDARDKAEQSHGDPKFEFPNLWGDLKEYLQDLYHDKCAYCDGSYEAFGYGDVEHFRPKGAVTDEPTHPGYWWLAYEPSNYLPSCQLCNQAAKKNHFPIEGMRAWVPEDPLEAEDPLLMHPDQDRWAGNVRFTPSTSVDVNDEPGSAKRLSDKGSKSIEVYKLNRKKLKDIRLREQQFALSEYRQALVSWVNSDDDRSLKALQEKCKCGLRPFHGAAMDEMNAYAVSKGFKLPFSGNGSGV